MTLPSSDEPGVWRPTPPTFAPVAVPWLGFVRPLVLRSPTQIPLPGPDDLDSAAYARDVREVQRFGAVNSVGRMPDLTQTALFWNDNPIAQLQAAMRGAVEDRGLGLVHSMRMFALTNTSTADALIGCWRAKYDEAFCSRSPRSTWQTPIATVRPPPTPRGRLLPPHRRITSTRVGMHA